MTQPMEWTPPGVPRPSAVTATLTALHTTLDDTAAAADGLLSDSDLTELLVGLTQATARLEALTATVAGAADARNLGQDDGATSTANWWAHRTRTTRAATHRTVRTARALPAYPLVEEAWRAGRLTTPQAQVILDALTALPTDQVDPQTRRQAEAHLVDQAREFDAKALRRIGQRILEVVAPDLADQIEHKRLQEQERHAEATASITMRDDGHGTTHGRFQVPTHIAAILRKHLMALAAPKHRHATTRPDTTRPVTDASDAVAGEPSASVSNLDSLLHAPEQRSRRVTQPLRLGQALCEYILRYPTDQTPDAGGVAATAVVTIPLDTLLGDNGTATLDDGTTLSAGEARHLACQAGIIPAVLDGQSQPLDIGRERRFHTRYQRIALALRDRGCSTEGCDWPPAMCHAHHDIPWSKDGPTTVDQGRLLCPRHHRMAHDPGFRASPSPHGKLRFTRRT